MGMQLLDALAALRSLRLPEQRTRTLCAVAAQARTDADRARIVHAATNEAALNRMRAERELQARFGRAAVQPVHGREAPSAPTVHVCPPEHPHGATGTCWRKHLCRCDSCVTAQRERMSEYRRAVREEQDRPVIVLKKRGVWTPKPIGADDPRHGKASTYKNYKCRCPACTEAKRQERRGSEPVRKERAEHGDLSRYTHGCRCRSCKDAARDYGRKWRARQKPH